MTREEAIEVYNELKNPKIKEAFKFFASELAKSEDEKVREEIITHFNDTINNIRSEEWISKEAKTIACKMQKWIAWLEKQKKQYALQLEDTSCVTIPKSPVYTFDVKKQKESLHIPQMCKENADSFTDEDERIRKFLIDILSSGTWRKEWPFSPVDCVAYLEKQKEQKLVEWNEEDERMFNRLVRRMDGHHYTYEVLQSMKRWLQERMKLLRPHWKPSEEQMDALMRTITWLVEKGNHTDSSTLADLRSNLQKLM